ncbi:PEP-CTERM/exosortase system-associated acyltransferase [Rhodocyclaceae bacterium SMB388]
MRHAIALPLGPGLHYNDLGRAKWRAREEIMTEPSFATRDLGEGFSSYFEILPALDDATRSQVFEVRHQVYCEDLGFEPVREDRRETDEFDRHSVHCLLRTSDPSHTLVGCTRLVLARPEAPDTLLPFERACEVNLDRHTVDARALPRNRIAEVSRLAVCGTFRRRRGEANHAVALSDSDFGTPAAPRFPFIPVALYLGTMAIALREGITQCFVLTEPRLAAHINRLGFALTGIGPPIEHHGTRVPSVIDVQGSVAGIRPLIRPMWEVIRGEIDAGYAAGANPDTSGPT